MYLKAISQAYCLETRKGIFNATLNNLQSYLTVPTETLEQRTATLFATKLLRVITLSIFCYIKLKLKMLHHMFTVI